MLKVRNLSKSEKKMVDIMVRESSACDIKGLFQKFIPETIGRFIEAECQGIYPLKDCYIRKAKVLRRPKFDTYKLADLHQEGSKIEDVGTPVKTGEQAAAVPVGGELKK